MNTRTPARTYNQNHIPRKYTAGKRRLSIYWTWSYPWESQRDPAAMENRFSTMTVVRTVLWPAYETPEWSAAQFLQGIAGTLELFHRSTISFQQIAGEATCRFRKFDPAWIRVVRQNHRIIRIDVCDPALARNVRRGLVQAAVAA